MKTQNMRSFLIGELCKLSRNGWAHAKPCDYEPLERELRKLPPRIRRRLKSKHGRI